MLWSLSVLTVITVETKMKDTELFQFLRSLQEFLGFVEQNTE